MGRAVVLAWVLCDTRSSKARSDGRQSRAGRRKGGVGVWCVSSVAVDGWLVADPPGLAPAREALSPWLQAGSDSDSVAGWRSLQADGDELGWCSDG